MKTKTFTSFTENGLDNKIAAFLASTDIEVIEIQFTGSLFYLGAMIVYK
ncbi:hypothetical protein ACFFH2_08595 [Enterococcus devriesei]|uniref:DUF2007 domain-containing protein n=1 Tax=Enterococcus devriesei TaxID=319970 RepID=A0A1L8SW17_9ENTE|nr:hypothetical protein [Enterococcus devriesei]MBU5366015.1 hypothetical protein [Enterococcus devriesei]MDT2823077.1 hypothetical protein [Enterococcus devriesei]OJG36163.1 hypothetical protein RV00_GL002307 [Enterococcus devriesei]